MSSVPSFREGSIESIAKVLAECGSGSDISRALVDRGLQDSSGQSRNGGDCIGYFWRFSDGTSVLTEYSTSSNHSLGLVGSQIGTISSSHIALD